nr:inositol monophosphatase family protein [Marinicella sp. W31]MDC2875952.1 hypothetical protein [Marinicella sp. W31]
MASRLHNNTETLAFLEQIGAADFSAVGSSLKFCLIAEGEADIYPRFGRTMEWDTAAGDAVLRAAGGKTMTVGPEPAELRYGKTSKFRAEGFENPFFVSSGI